MIEHMLQHPEQRPIRQLLPACLSCLSTVTDELRALRDRLLQARNDWRAIPIHTAHFPVHTPARPAAGAGDRALPAAAADARGDGRTLRDAPGREREEAARARRDGGGERRASSTAASCSTAAPQLTLSSLPLQAYISTDDPAFLAELAAVVKKLVNRMDASLLRSLLVSYYSTVQRALNNGAPKAIMRLLVRGCHESVYGYMFDRIAPAAEGRLGRARGGRDEAARRHGDLGEARVACQALSSLST